MLRMLRPERQKKIRHAFSQSEDENLRKLVEEYGENNWTLIASNMPHRNARQCRDRWRCYLRPSLVTTEWTEEEDKLLLQKYYEYGTKFSVIGRFLPNRSEVSLKNRLRLLNKYMFAMKPTPAPVYPWGYPSNPQLPPQFPPMATPVYNKVPVSSKIQKKEKMSQSVSSDSSPDTSAVDAECVSAPQDLANFFSTISISNLLNGHQSKAKT